MYNFKETEAQKLKSQKLKISDDIQNSEERILKFWSENKIYEKSKKKNEKGKKFYFMDGPPYATGHIHIGTALNKILKDISMRSRRIQGFDVFDRPGYDTHGVPIEFQVEKEIGSKSKQDIEKYGVAKFIERCKKFATQYIEIMNNEFMSLGVWMDWNNPYLTLNDEYIEAIWHAFKEADKKDLLYLGKYCVHVCPRCETAVAYNEIIYEKKKDNSAFVKFPLKDKKNTFLIIWTTTPWTLPGNTGVMVHPDITYQEIEVHNKETWIIAKELVPKITSIIKSPFKVKNEYKGKKMEGWKYENPISKYLKLNLKNAYKVVLSSRYVTTEEGTGLVHTAPGHGKEDYEVGKEYGLDMPSPVSANGMLTEETGKYSGKKARVVDKEIIDDLKKDGFLVHEMIYEHDYPLCWRDKEPLLMIAQPQWFLKISKIHEKLLKENDNTKWLPQSAKLRMKAWLEGIGDWPVSRQRYWGTPLPIWYDPDSKEKIVVGSISELEKLSGKAKITLHKPEIDNVVIKGKSGKILKRVPEVLDVWFDSGVSSWAALGYPQNNKLFKRFWPADLNIEGRDQFRGWWNSQLILSLIAFGKKPFESILVHGMILDIGKKKMSKSLGNIVSPEEVIKKYGRDLMRYYFAKFSRGEDFSYDEREFKEINKILMNLINVNNFTDQLSKDKQVNEIEDKWIISKFYTLAKKVEDNYNKYRFFDVTKDFEDFLLFDLSRGYIQMIRERSDETYSVLNEIRLGLLKLLAPICPFITDSLWQKLRENKIVKEESVHLSEWPKIDLKKINKKLEEDFAFARALIEKGLAERDKLKIGLKWPLAKATLFYYKKFDKELEEIIARQLNVKKIEFKETKEENNWKVEFDTNITPELELEGIARELSREVQSERKNAGLNKSDSINLIVSSDKDTMKKLEQVKEVIMKRTGAAHLSFEKKQLKFSKKFKIKDKEYIISFVKV